jgi:hypothetical protein
MQDEIEWNAISSFNLNWTQLKWGEKYECSGVIVSSCLVDSLYLQAVVKMNDKIYMQSVSLQIGLWIAW